MDFLDWVRQYTGLQTEGQVLPSKVYQLMNVDVSEGVTYCLQHYFEDLAAYNRFVASGEMAFREELAGTFGDKMIVFSSVLAEV